MGLERSYEVMLCKVLPEWYGLEGRKHVGLAREPGFMALLFYLTVALVKSFNVSELYCFYL